MPKNPHANFRPTLESYSGQGAFRFWCQMALPLTYDDSLSYYELLNKVVAYLNNTIEDVGKVEDNVTALNEAYGKLEDYVNTYFDEIDIEAELRNILDAMAEDGSLDSLLDPLVAARLGDVVAEQINAVVANQIGNVVSEQIDDAVIENLPAVVPGAVSNWLDENVTPTTPVVDNTLTISGAAADAKVTGNNITNLKTALLQKFKMYSCENLLDNVTYRTVTNNGVHFEQDGIGIHIEGTSNAAIVYDFFVDNFPAWLDTGVEYHVQFDNDNPNILFQIYAYDPDGFNQLVYNRSGNGSVTFSPNYSTTIRMRIRINAANVSVNKTFYPSITDTLTNRELESALNSAFKGEILVNSATTLADLNDAVINRYYSINVTDLEHQPMKEKGHLLYFGINGGENTPLTGRAVQLYITNSGGIFFRFVYFSSPVEWSEWEELAETAYTSISLFENIGIIGDSFASGEIYINGTHDDYYNISWGKILERAAGISVTNYSAGGLTAKTWLTDSAHGSPAMDADNSKQLYIVALGINDARIFGTSGLGTSSDLSMGSTADTFYRYMGNIRRAIKAHAPNSIIIWSTIARFGNTTYPYDDYSNAIKIIASYFSDPVIDLSTDDYFVSNFFDANQVSNHPTAITYSGMAEGYKRLIEKYMRNNPNKFTNFVG